MYAQVQTRYSDVYVCVGTLTCMYVQVQTIDQVAAEEESKAIRRLPGGGVAGAGVGGGRECGSLAHMAQAAGMCLCVCMYVCEERESVCAWCVSVCLCLCLCLCVGCVCVCVCE